MIGWFLKRIAAFLRSIADICDPTHEQLVAKHKIEGRSFSEPFDETKPYPDEPVCFKQRMKALLALDEPTPEEAKELAELASHFGPVIFLDDPVGAEKEHL